MTQMRPLSRRLGPLVAASLLALVVVAVTGCSSDGPLADRMRRDMLLGVPAGSDAKLVTLIIEDSLYGRVTVEQRALEYLQRRPGVLQVRRGRGRNEAYVLCESTVDPYRLGDALPENYRARVAGVLTQKDLPPPGVDLP